MTDVELAEAAARWWCRRGGSSDPGEWVGVAWEGIASRAASRARRGLPPMDGKQRYLAARSAIIDFARCGQGGFGDTRSRAAFLVPLSDVGDDLGDALDPADHRATVVVPEVPQFGGRRPWTAAERTAMRKALAAGATAREVGSGLGRSQRSVWWQSRLIGAAPGRRTGRPPNLAQRSELTTLLAAGMPVRRAALRMGLSPEAAFYKVRLMVRDGVLVRTGGASRSCLYVPVGGVA
jgi:hypothetical protein